MSHFDNLVTAIADGVLAAYQEAPGDFDTVDVTDPASSILDGEFDLTAIAKAIVAAGWVHADELDQLRASVDRVRRLANEDGNDGDCVDCGRWVPISGDDIHDALDGGA